MECRVQSVKCKAFPMDTAMPQENQRLETRHVGASKRAFRARIPPIFTLCSCKIHVFRPVLFATSKSMFRARLASLFSISHKTPRKTIFVTRNEATRRLKPPKVTPFAELPIGSAIRPSRGRLRTVANGGEGLRVVADGCGRKRNVERRPSTPRPPE